MARTIKIPAWKFQIPRLPQVDPDVPDVFEEMTLQEHLIELRDRIMKTCIGIGIAFVFGFLLAPRLLEAMVNSAQVPDGFDIRSPTDPLMIWFKVALYIAIAITLPLTVYQFVAFLAPGLTRKEKRIIYTSLPFVAVLFAAGVSYAYFVAAPAALNFLSGVLPDVFNWDIDADETLSFYLTLMMGLGLAFQLPVIMFLVAKIGIVSPKQMRQFRRYAILIIAVLSAIITPSTDPFNLMLVAIPLYILYEGGIIISSVFAKTGLRTASETEDAETADDV
jgi:sec-independent protein translocase protein TatC